jgi:hypothetical protein
MCLFGYYNILILNFYYHTSQIALYDILFQKLLVRQYFLSTQANRDLWRPYDELILKDKPQKKEK